MPLKPIANSFQGYKTNMSQISYRYCPLNSGYRDGINSLSAAITNIPLMAYLLSRPCSTLQTLTLNMSAHFLINEQYVVTIHSVFSFFYDNKRTCM